MEPIFANETLIWSELITAEDMARGHLEPGWVLVTMGTIRPFSDSDALILLGDEDWPLTSVLREHHLKPLRGDRLKRWVFARVGVINLLALKLRIPGVDENDELVAEPIARADACEEGMVILVDYGDTGDAGDNVWGFDVYCCISTLSYACFNSYPRIRDTLPDAPLYRLFKRTSTYLLK